MTSIGLGKTILLVVIMVSICGCTAVNPNNIVIQMPVEPVGDTGTVAGVCPLDANGTLDANSTCSIENPTENLTEVLTEVPTDTPTAEPTPTPTKPEVTPTNIVQKIITPNITYAPTAIPTPTVRPTRAPRTRTLAPTPVPTMNETHPYLAYSDSDFKVEYPSNWTVESSSVPTTYNRLSEHMRLQGDARQVIFRGDDPEVSFIVTTTDLLVPGSETLHPDINLVSDMVTQQFTDVSGWSAVSNYVVKYTALYKTPIAQFDVTVPDSSASYPLTYTEQDVVSYNSFYTIRFSTPGNADTYKDIKQHLFSSLQTGEIVKV
jgi:hypothetical protein